MATAAAERYLYFAYGLVIAVLLLALIVPPVFIGEGPLLYATVVSAPCIGLAYAVLFLYRIRQGGSSASPWLALFFFFFGYLVLGVVFTLGYMAASGLGSQLLLCEESIRDFPRLLYFSLLTATTFACGDCAPGASSNLHRFLICTEVVEFWIFFVLAIFLLQESVKVRDGSVQCPLFPSSLGSGGVI